MIKKVIKIISGALLAAVIVCSVPNTVEAAEATIAQTITANQNAALLANAQALQEYQQALLLQYQQAVADQYAKAVFLQQALAKQQVAAYEQSLMLNSVRTMQLEQYKALLANTNKEYSDYLLAAYTYDQNSAKLPFQSLYGLK